MQILIQILIACKKQFALVSGRLVLIACLAPVLKATSRFSKSLHPHASLGGKQVVAFVSPAFGQKISHLAESSNPAHKHCFVFLKLKNVDWHEC